MSRRSSRRARELRIGGGLRRGMKIESVPKIRPTLSWVRQALFDIWGRRVAGSAFLDLFAGSGAVGIEAVSRGAARAVLVESSREALAVLEGNVGRAALPGVSVVRARLPGELERRLPAAMRFDLIFADPPYALADYAELLAGAGELLGEDGRLAVEHSRRRELPPAAGSLERSDERNYGDKVLSFYRR